MAVADPQLIDMRHRRPAATGDDLVVGRDRLLGELLGRRRQHRRRSFRHMDGARGLVEILAELAGTAVVHERVERVVGEGAAGKAGQRDRAGTARKKGTPIDAFAAAVAPGLFHGAISWSCPLAGRSSMPATCRQRVLVPDHAAPCPATAYGRQIYDRIELLQMIGWRPAQARDRAKKYPGSDAGVLSYASTTETMADWPLLITADILFVRSRPALSGAVPC